MKEKNIQVISKHGKRLAPCNEKTAWVLLSRKRAIKVSEDTIRIVIDKEDLKRIRKAVIERDNRTCIYCGRKIPEDEVATVDHLIAKHINNNGDSGYDSMENLACSCEACNTHKGMRSFDDYCMLRMSFILALYSNRTGIKVKCLVEALAEK